MERSPFSRYPRAAIERHDSGEYEHVIHLEKGHTFQLLQLLSYSGGSCWHCWCSDAVQQVVEEHGGRVHQTRQEQGLQGLRPSHIIKHLDYFPSLSIPIWISPGLQNTITLTDVLQAHPLSVQNIGGVFVVLLCGLALAIMVIIRLCNMRLYNGGLWNC